MRREALTAPQRACLDAALRAKALVHTHRGWRAIDDVSGRGYFSGATVGDLVDLGLLDMGRDRREATPSPRAAVLLRETVP